MMIPFIIIIILVVLLIILKKPESFQIFSSVDDIPILIISNSENFSRSTIILNRLGFKNIKRIPPVYLKDGGNCKTKNISLSELGVSKAHQRCFNEVLKINKDSIILEEDWRYSLSDDLFLKKLIDYYNYFKSNKLDLLWLGHCGQACMHAYIMSPKSVNSILNLDYCNKPIDVIMYNLCSKKTLKCFKVSDEEHDTKMYFGRGIIFQDRNNIKGMHDHNNKRTSKFKL